MSRNLRNYYKKLKFSDAKNTGEIDAFFFKPKSGENAQLAVDEQSENKPLSSDTMIDFIKQSESRPSALTSSAESHFTHVAGSETWF